MSDGKTFELDSRLEPKLQTIANSVYEVAESARGNSLQILALLRLLESLHQEIRDSLFQESLPDNRQALYNLLKDIETMGGWPYIHRMKLQALLTQFQGRADLELPPTLSNLSSEANSEETAG